jgi:arsenate reductase
MSIKIFGIPNCNTVKKARDWLVSHNIEHEFIDFKKQIPTEPQLLAWYKKVGPELLINQKGTTWRSLSADQQLLAQTQTGAIELMQSKPSIIKRPVLQQDGEILLGFDAIKYADLFKKFE